MARLERVVEHDALVLKVGGLSRVAVLWKCSTGQLTQYVRADWGVSEFTVSWLKFWICLCVRVCVFLKQFNHIKAGAKKKKSLKHRDKQFPLHWW